MAEGSGVAAGGGTETSNFDPASTFGLSGAPRVGMVDGSVVTLDGTPVGAVTPGGRGRPAPDSASRIRLCLWQ